MKAFQTILSSWILPGLWRGSKTSSSRWCCLIIVRSFGLLPSCRVGSNDDYGHHMLLFLRARNKNQQQTTLCCRDLFTNTERVVEYFFVHPLLICSFLDFPLSPTVFQMGFWILQKASNRKVLDGLSTIF